MTLRGSEDLPPSDLSVEAWYGTLDPGRDWRRGRGGIYPHRILDAGPCGFFGGVDGEVDPHGILNSCSIVRLQIGDPNMAGKTTLLPDLLVLIFREQITGRRSRITGSLKKTATQPRLNF